MDFGNKRAHKLVLPHVWPQPRRVVGIGRACLDHRPRQAYKQFKTCEVFVGMFRDRASLISFAAKLTHNSNRLHWPSVARLVSPAKRAPSFRDAACACDSPRPIRCVTGKRPSSAKALLSSHLRVYSALSLSRSLFSLSFSLSLGLSLSPCISLCILSLSLDASELLSHGMSVRGLHDRMVSCGR